MSFHDSHENASRPPAPRPSEPFREIIVNAVGAGIERYVRSRKDKVPAFVERHFSLRGALRLHRKALGKDLFRVPLNVLWMGPLTVVKARQKLLQRAGADKLARRLDCMPAGFQTDVQKEINWLIYTELLELPYRQDSRSSTKDALLEAILQENRLAGLIEQSLADIHKKSTDPDFRLTLQKNLHVYGLSRTASAELAANLITLSSTYFAFNKAMPGALTTGSALAAAIAQQIAISNFWLGPTLGAWYYGLFPATASAGLVVAATGAVMAGLGLVTTFAGIVADPLQAKLGLHQKRLSAFIDALGEEMRGTNQSPYKINEIYLTRVFDIVDLLMIALR